VHVVADRCCGFFLVIKAFVELYVKISIDLVVCCLALKFAIVVVFCSSRVEAAAASHLRGSGGTISGTDGWAAAASG
jgi:hypothetical protein